MRVEEIEEKLNLSSIQGRTWHVQSSCAINGDGLLDGLTWLANQFKSGKKAKSGP